MSKEKTKIKPESYTMNVSSAHSTQNDKKITIDDSRFNWDVNALQIPTPRRFSNKKKLYPSGSGSTVPLNLSLYK